MKTKNLLFILVLLLHAGLTHAQTSPDDCWGYVNTLQDEWLRKICTVGPDTVYIVGENGLIARSTDRGETWDKQYIGTAHLNDVKFIDPRTGFAVGEGGAILKTADAGETWTQQTSGTTENINALAFTDLDNLWAVGAKSLVLHSTDGGVTWEKKDIVDVECTLNDIAFQGNLGYFVGDYGVVYKTEERGKDWEKQEVLTNPGSGVVFKSLNIMENKTYMIQKEADIFSTEDQKTWIRQNVINYEDIYFINNDTGYYLVCPGITTSGDYSMEYIAVFKTLNGSTNQSEDKAEQMDDNSFNYSTGQLRGKDYCNEICMVNENIGYALSGQILIKKPALTYTTVGMNVVLGQTALLQVLNNELIVTSLYKDVLEVDIFDSKGRLVSKSNEKSGNLSKFNTHHFDIGVYFVNVIFSDNTRIVKKWIKW